ncbi:alpha/beta fold hydrolase [Streptomyces sp. SID5914]|nr:alpha/beta hydrolase [Streptomyces sp. SID5914]MZG15874.1 alpha/beta fold hydrolase [Streptomyces sp. SID5914]
MIQHRTLEANGVRLHVAEAGEGPLVVLLHGFPECWYSWRHQLTALADAGYHVVAPDQRGYGTSDRPEAVDAYTIFDLTGDVIGLIHALGDERAFVVGHDWGAQVAWHTALFRPDVVRGVAGLSIPPLTRMDTPPLRTMRELFDGQFYWNYFETPGVAEAEFSRDVRTALLRLLYADSGDNHARAEPGPQLVAPGGGFLDGMPEPAETPAWFTQEDLDVFTESFTASGFAGPLNWYRNMDHNWRLTAPWARATLHVPAMYAVGDRDPVMGMFGGAEQLRQTVMTSFPTLSDPLVLPGTGHWIQQERPTEVNAALVDFLKSAD